MEELHATVFEIADRMHIQRLGRRATVITPRSPSTSEAMAIMTGAANPRRRSPEPAPAQLQESPPSSNLVA